MESTKAKLDLCRSPNAPIHTASKIHMLACMHTYIHEDSIIILKMIRTALKQHKFSQGAKEPQYLPIEDLDVLEPEYKL